MKLHINVVKEGAKRPKLTVNGYRVERFGILDDSIELIKSLFGNTVSTKSFKYSSTDVLVEDTKKTVYFNGTFDIFDTDSGDDVADRITERLALIKDAVESARSVSYSYSKVVEL